MKKDSSCAIIPSRPEASLMNFAYGSAKKISMRNVNPLAGLASQNSHLQEMQPRDTIIESIKKIESAAKKRHT